MKIEGQKHKVNNLAIMNAGPCNDSITLGIAVWMLFEIWSDVMDP